MSRNRFAGILAVSLGPGLICWAGLTSVPPTRPVIAHRATGPIHSETIRFNEVLADPPGAGQRGAGEWIELYNAGAVPVDLNGWLVGDAVDPSDRVVPWAAGGSTVLHPGGYALIVDPDTRPPPAWLTGSTLLLRPDDSSLGNGLRSDGDSLLLTDPRGVAVDSASWVVGAGDGISWERSGSLDTGAAGAGWRICRALEGSTPGQANSWTPVAGDRAIGWRTPGNLRCRAGRDCVLTATVSDEGNSGLQDLLLEASLVSEDGTSESLGTRRIAWIAPGDSIRVTWVWRPRAGGRRQLNARIVAPVRARDWGDTDSVELAASYQSLARLLTEAVPRPLPGQSEWIELWAPPGDEFLSDQRLADWAGWSVRVRSISSPGSAGRIIHFEPISGSLLLLTSGDEPPEGYPDEAFPAGTRWLTWGGLRLPDGGSVVVLTDPTGAVVDSALLRPVPGLPRGHAWQRWDHTLPGWVPEAWGVSASPSMNTPGRHDTVTDSLKALDPPAGSGDRTFQFVASHRPDGSVELAWNSRTVRLWLECRLYDLSGRLAATPIVRAMARGSDRAIWRPGEERPPIRPGLYILVVEVRDVDGPSRWSVKRALGIRP